MNKSIKAVQAQAHQEMGYCPQKDALLPLLTPREHLLLFAGLQGVMRADAAEHAEQLMVFLDLRQFATTRADHLSGGNRRKLSLALALLGQKSVIFLDEPSAGVLWVKVRSAGGKSGQKKW